MRETLNNIIYMARRFKLATTFNMIGLVVSFATFYLLMTQINYERTYNQGIADHERIYRLESSYYINNNVWAYSDYACSAFADALGHMPQVESFSLMRDVNEGVNSLYEFKKSDGTDTTYNINVGNNQAVSTLAKKIAGEIEWNDSDKSGIIIPAKIAIDYFDTTQAVGKEMLLCIDDSTGNSTLPYKVRGVYEDFPENSDMPNCIFFNTGEPDPMPFNGDYKCYIKLKARPDNLDSCAQVFKQAILKNMNDSIMLSDEKQFYVDNKRELENHDFKLTELSKTYFSKNTFSTSRTGFEAMFYMLIMVCVLVMIISTINFVNFTLAESPMRIRSLNTRLVLGASRKSLRQSLVAECIITSVTACLMALIICALLSTWDKSSLLLDGPLAPYHHIWLVLLMLVMAVLIGIVAGIYPAIFATSFPPALALKGSFGLTRDGNKLRSNLVFVQLFIAMLMSLFFSILYLQNEFIYNTFYGFDKNQIITARLPQDLDSLSRAKIYHELTTMPGTEQVAYSSRLLGSTDAHNIIKAESDGNYISYSYLDVDNKYMHTLGIKITEGRDFTPKDTSGVIINMAAHKQWNWLETGKKISISTDQDGDSASIIGVCDNVRYGTTRNTNDQPFAFILVPEIADAGIMNIRIAADANMKKMKEQIAELLKEHADGDQIEVNTFDNELKRIYQKEFRFYRLLSIMTIICVLITFIGVFCLTMFETEQRRKEIGIRKIAGASTGEIMWMLCRRYGTLILISFVVAVPVAIFCGLELLDYFVEHTDIKWWIFPLALIFVGGIMLGTVALRSWRTAHENPVNSIKTE